MKYFIGILVPEEIQKLILELATSLPKDFTKSRMNAHITIRAPQFVADMVLIESIVKSVANTFCPIDIGLGKVKNFDNNYLVVSAQSKLLYELNEKLARSLQKFNDENINYYDFEKYRPHVKIAEIPGKLTIECVKKFEENLSEITKSTKNFSVKNLTIFIDKDDTGVYDQVINIPFQPNGIMAESEDLDAPWNANFYEKVEDGE